MVEQVQVTMLPIPVAVCVIVELRTGSEIDDVVWRIVFVLDDLSTPGPTLQQGPRRCPHLGERGDALASARHGDCQSLIGKLAPSSWLLV